MGIIVFSLICLFNCFCGWIIYLIYHPIKKKLIKNEKLSIKRNKQILISLALVLYFLSIYQTYDAFFPGESFYEREYEYVTMRKIPPSASFISKTATYPDFHGDYCSASMISISKSDYKKLLKEMKNDINLKQTEIYGSAELDEVMGKKNNDIAFSFQRNIAGEEDKHLYICFLNDGRTIVVEVCVT